MSSLKHQAYRNQLTCSGSGRALLIPASPSSSNATRTLPRSSGISTWNRREACSRAATPRIPAGAIRGIPSSSCEACS